ncbi:hypothetical protein FGM00_02640 [Aggregatimonas sangjinii]|uniref:Uncharacterized protein n=1 Tax=Aggregatimonas sangjinii TaxID=2583587 RepID=A0A5B7SKQ8_9FLAO|nr:hypothetical protein [Aggregatimonas sangjinii]QCW99066.1 hypothetical protein FGM00_02640 [Aggregatimonas sangjinii]
MIQNRPKYTYRLRPGYGTDRLLIEFNGLEDPEYFLFEILHMLGLAGFKSKEMLNLWMNDEIQVNLSSQNGPILVSLDIYGLVFIVGNNNQKDILRIDELLQKSGAFVKNDINYSSYRTK